MRLGRSINRWAEPEPPCRSMASERCIGIPQALPACPAPKQASGSWLSLQILQIGSQVDANAFGPGAPATDMQGVTSSDTEICPIPSLAVVHREAGSPWSFGLGGFAIGGFGVDFPASTTNPIFTPQPPHGGMGFGAIYSEFQLMQFCPTVAYQSTSGWALGFAPTINWASLAISPFSAGAPNGDGTYPSAAHGDTSWGIGFSSGLVLSVGQLLEFGVSYKSPQWFEDFKFNSYDHAGAPRQLVMDLDYPSILSLGLGYVGFQDIKLACDVRYIDYENTDGFQSAGFDANGAVTGFGWQSIWAFSLGAEFTLTDHLTWRCGYTFNECPIDSQTMFYNSPAPALIQHHLSTGFTCRLESGWTCSLAYHHGLKNSVSGPWHHPAMGEINGTRITGSLATHGVIGGVSKQF